MAEDLNNKIVKGVSWNLIETGTSYFVRFVIGIILARLLTPADFGIIGMTAIFISVSDVFVRAGFGQAFIYKKNVTAVDANTVFFLNLGVSVVIYAILFFAAPFIAEFFHTAALTEVIRLLCLVIIVNSMNVIQFSMIRREMQFKRKAIITVCASLAGGIIGIIMAYSGFGVWSLVVQQLSNRIFTCCLLYTTSSWRLSFSFSWGIVREMFGYSLWVLFSDIIATLMNNFYRLAIGKVYSPGELGYYDRAHQFQALIADTFTWVFGMVAFPSFTKVKEDTEELKKLTSNYLSYSTFIIFPLLLILLVVAKPFILLLLTEKWLSVVPLLKIFCVIGLLIPVNFYLSPLLQACGATRMDFMSTTFMSVMRILNVVFFLRYGVSYILYGEIAILALNILLVSLLSKKHLGFNYLSMFRPIKINILTGGVTLVAGLLVSGLAGDTSPWIELLVPLFAMGICYCVLNLLFQRNLVMSLKRRMLKR